MYKSFIKRILDFTISLIAILILLPLWLPICLILFLTGEHEVFYFQERIGYKNKPFFIWKHATMVKNSPNIGNGLHTTRNDPRVLPFGKILRKTKINELPQIINILIGDMSIVGPRPLVDKTFDPYPEHVKAVIYNVKPGLTGIGSIVFRDEEKLLSETSLPPQEFYAKHISPYKGELELWYQSHLSIYTDMILIFLTAWVILSPKSDLVNKLFKDLPAKPEIFKLQ
jgi:lipopolysaccharide/colanic/teichoic acid biosynthesis glycosyltransferase